MRLAKSLFLWSWIVTLPVTLLGGYWVFSTVERFHTYKVRYNPVNKSELDLGNIAKYEIARLVQRIRAGVENNFVTMRQTLNVSTWLFRNHKLHDLKRICRSQALSTLRRGYWLTERLRKRGLNTGATHFIDGRGTKNPCALKQRKINCWMVWDTVSYWLQ